MPFLGTGMSSKQFACMSARGFVGPELKRFVDACGLGSQQSVVGKQFTTTDTGTIPGAGVGSGVGVVVPKPTIAQVAFSKAQAAGFTGPKLFDTCDCFAEALTQESALATLTSSHTPVFAGVGSIVQGSITVANPEWGGNINSKGQSFGFTGDRWPVFAQSLSEGALAGYAVGTGSVTITGSPSGTPGPGGGTGTGTIT